MFIFEQFYSNLKNDVRIEEKGTLFFSQGLSNRKKKENLIGRGYMMKLTDKQNVILL